MKARFTSPQITELISSNENKTKNFIRPKRKRTPTTTTTATTPLASSHLLITKSKAICNNPLDRLSELLLNWNIISGNTTDNNNSSSSGPATGNSEQDSKDSAVKNVLPVPDVFESYKQYVAIWEPLFILETKASIYSSLSLEENFGKCRVTLLNYEEKSVIVKIQGNFGIDANSRNMTPQTMSLVLFSTVNLYNPQSRNFVNPLPANSGYFLGIVATQIRGAEAHLLVSRTQLNEFFTHDSNASRQKLQYESKRSAESRPMALQLEYRVVTGLVSQWREFLALHEAYRSSILPVILNPLFGTSVARGDVSAPIIIDVDGDDDDDDGEGGHSTKTKAPSTPPTLIPKGFEIPESEIALGELGEDYDKVVNVVNKPKFDSLLLPPSVTSASNPPDGTNSSSSISQIATSTREKWRMDGVGDAFNIFLHAKYNYSQLQAIRNCVETTTGFSLVQGPPGTGKTSTILGLLNAVHIRDYNKYFEALLGNILGADGIQCRERGLDPIPWDIPHLLVVAPSNVAVDNIIERIIENGFRDSSGSLYYPNILRIGSGKIQKNLDSPCRSVTLDESVENMLNTDGANCHSIDQQLTETILITLQSILQLQTVLLNLKLCWESHPLDVGWELRINEVDGRPYWVDHIKKTTQWVPPTPPPPGKLYVPDFTLQTLPEFKYYTHLIVQKLEELRLLHLRKVRVRVIVEWTSSQTTRIGTNGNTFRTGNSMNSLRHSLETSFIEEADIVFTTLNSSGHPCLEGSIFPVVIIDEAGQCVEPSTLIPLRMGCHQCILVGDQQQLSATIFSKLLSSKGYNQSLFERLDKIRTRYGIGSVMLDTQYRMLPEISKFPSQKFYHGSLKDGENVKAPGYGPRYLGALQPERGDHSADLKFYLKPFLFFNLMSSQDCIGDTQSRSNLEEAKLCCQLVKFLIYESRRDGSGGVGGGGGGVGGGSGVGLGSIGIITPYQEQLNEMRRLFVKEQLLPVKRGSQQNNQINFIKNEKDMGGKPQPSQPPQTSTTTTTKTTVVEDVEDGEIEQEEEDNVEEKNAVLYDDLFQSTPPYDTQHDHQRVYPDLELNTVDAFQGREKDIVIISCVRANDLGTIGFLSDIKRMNVAITRARYGLYVIGNATTLQNNRDWNDLILHARAERRLVTMRTSQDDISQVLQSLPSQSSSSSNTSFTPQTSSIESYSQNNFSSNRRRRFTPG